MLLNLHHETEVAAHRANLLTELGELQGLSIWLCWFIDFETCTLLSKASLVQALRITLVHRAALISLIYLAMLKLYQPHLVPYINQIGRELPHVMC